MRTTLIILLLFLTSLGSWAQTSWTAGNGDFSGGSNWNNGAPGASTPATISTTGTLFITLSSPDTIGSLLTTGSGTVNLALGANSLTITGTSSSALAVNNGSTLTLTGTVGGGITVQNGQIAIGDNSGNAGTLNLAGGTLSVGGVNGIAAGTGSAVINGSGGTIKVINSSLTTGIAMTLASNTYTTINTNGLDATFNGNITNTAATNGGLTKTGSGNLSLNGSANTAASFYILGGTVSQGTGSSLTASEIGIGTGAGVTGSYTMTGGTLTMTAGAPPPIVGGSASSLRIGDFGGTGTFTQSGGTVNIYGSLNVGNQGGHGTYALNGGSLNIESSFSTLARTAGSTGGSTGTFALSGSGVLNIDGTAAFILSNWYPSSATTQGVGTLNQTGGTIAVANTASLILTGLGTGNYNLNGGTLQIGGNSLQGNYPSQGGTYHFNLGGGTIKVIGSDLSTSVNGSLTASTTSTIDTNGLNATLSGSLSGSGKLAKAGSGNLTLTNANTYSGGTAVNAGKLTINNTSGSATGTGTLTVASGTTLAGTGIATPSSFDIQGTVQAGNGLDTTSSLTLTNTGSSTFTNATLKFNLGNIAGQSNELHLGLGIVDFNNTMVVLSISSYPPADSIYTLIDNGTGSNTYTGLTLSGTDTHGYSIITGGLTIAANNGSHLFLNGGTIGFSESSLVPEPGTWALLLAGLVTLGAFHLRRRARVTAR